MRIAIKERPHEYQSDYPEGWRFSAGDYFKFPVQIGNYACFIKRFEKEPDQIEGWALLAKLKGKYTAHSPRIYDIATVTEKGRTVQYVFYEYVEGKTLDRVLSERLPVDLRRLTTDLVAALKVIHDQGFWFADFTEKNIFCAKGRYLLLDLDSAQPAAKRPTHDMFGDKEYWSLVFDFYTKRLQRKHFRAADLRGAALDYLQIPFLILRLRLYYRQSEQEYKSDDMRNRLLAELNEADPRFSELFGNALEKEGRLLAPPEIEQLVQLIEQRIVGIPRPVDQVVELPLVVKLPPDAEPPPVVEARPVIKHFALSKREAGRAERFSVQWEVEGAEQVELYRDGILLNTLAAGDRQLDRAEFYDSDQAVTYQLVARNGAGRTESQPVVVQATKGPIDAPKWWDTVPAAAVSQLRVLLSVFLQGGVLPGNRAANCPPGNWSRPTPSC